MNTVNPMHVLWLDGLGCLFSYELVERLEVGISDKERIGAVERLVLPSVFLYIVVVTCI